MDGVKVTLRKKKVNLANSPTEEAPLIDRLFSIGLAPTLMRSLFPAQKKQHWMDENKMYLMHHPIYRYFFNYPRFTFYTLNFSGLSDGIRKNFFNFSVL